MDQVYSVQALRWKALSSSSLRSAVRNRCKETVSPDLVETQEKVELFLEKQKWLLEEDQHLVVPSTHLDRYEGRIYSMRDFVKRTDMAREADVIRTSVDEDGNRQILSAEQRQHLRQTGELVVPSKLFQNQCHTWKVSPAFFSGTEPVQDSFFNGLGMALDHYVVYSNDTITKIDRDNTFRPSFRKSLEDGIKGSYQQFRRAIGQLFVSRLRHPTYTKHRIEELMSEAETGYVLYHLRDQDTRCLSDRLTTEITESRKHAWKALNGDAEFDQKYRPSPIQCQTAKEAQDVLHRMRDDFNVKMISMRKQHLPIDQVKCTISPLAAITEANRADQEWAEFQTKTWIEYLKNQPQEYLRVLGRLEEDRLRAEQIEIDTRREDSQKVAEHTKNFEVSLKRRRPLLCLSKEWRTRKLHDERQRMEGVLELSFLDRVAQKLEKEGLHLHCTARKMSAIFRRDHRDILVERLQKKMSAFPPAEFHVLQLNPNNWDANGNRHKIVKVDLDKPMWRIRYTWMTGITHAKRLIGSALFLLTSGPFSLRALVASKPFYAIERPTRDERTLTQTLRSRISSFQESLKRVLKRFDEAPDTGLIGKSVQSFFLRVYLALKGILGQIWIVMFMTVGTAASTLFTVLVLALAPIVAAAMAACAWVFNIMLFDTALKRASMRASYEISEQLNNCISPMVRIGVVIPYKLLLPGLLQSALASFRLLVVHPGIGTAAICWTCLRFMARWLRDLCTWQIIRTYSRIPASDTFLAWRIHGPGLAALEYYRLPVEASKTSVLLALDHYRLLAHASVRRCELEAPYHCYALFFRQLVKPYDICSSLGVQSPSNIAARIEWRVNSDGNRSKTFAKDRPLFDVWDAVAQGVRSSHPDTETSLQAFLLERWETGSKTPSLTDLDAKLTANLNTACLAEMPTGRTELNNLVNRTAKTLAEWNLKINMREARLLHARAIPPEAMGRFRMSEAELQELWHFTVKNVEAYGVQIREELQEILETSEFSKEIRKTVDRVADSFYTDSGARPNQDIPRVAAFLLRRLFGGDSMLETLEQTDEKLVLVPKMPEEDQHLCFWKSFVSAQ